MGKKKWINSSAISPGDVTVFNYINTAKPGDDIEGSICVGSTGATKWFAGDDMGPADNVGQAKNAVETLTKITQPKE